MNSPESHVRRRLPWIALACVVLAGSAYWFLQPGPGKAPDEPPPVNPERTPPREVDSGPPWFLDVTAKSGVNFTQRNGEEAKHATILESLGGGVALLDYDGDGRLDIFVLGGGYFDGPTKTEIKGHPCRLYRNLGDFRFQDVTQAAGLERTWDYNHGAAVADYDRDGWPDLVVTGYGRLLLFHNEVLPSGARGFVEVSERLGLKDNSWSTSAGWADVDGDGYPDLYVCHYVNWSFANNPPCLGSDGVRLVCAPSEFKPLVHSLFRNDRGRGFKDVAVEQGFKPAGNGLGVVLADVNQDGKPDIYVANDATNNFLYFNRGSGKLEERGFDAGVAVDDQGRPDGSMGTDIGDFDGSGRASIWVTNFQGETHALYQNLGKELFTHQSRPVGIAAIGMHLVAFGTTFLDADNDGWEDLAFVNGHVMARPILGGTVKQKPVLLHNTARGPRRFFDDVSGRGGEFFRTPAVGRGLAVGDLDNDGWPDLVISNVNSPVALLRNVAGKSSPNTRWLGIRLLGRDHRDVVGSTATVNVGSRQLTRFIKGGGSYLSSSDRRILFGLGTDQAIRKLTVKWSWGETQTWENLEPGAYWDLREGDPKASRMATPR